MSKEIQSTKNYDMFKFRSDNRESINENHIKHLIKSISTRNLLEMRPITVNPEMEVIDGQHRLLAAKELDVPIYYIIEEDIQLGDLVLLNRSKAWSLGDYLNFYAKNCYPEYQKLKNHISEKNIGLSCALRLMGKNGSDNLAKFKLGQFEMSEEVESLVIDIVKETVETINKFNGKNGFLSSGKFWNAMAKLINNRDFSLDRWRLNLPKMVERIVVKVSTNDYYKLFLEIHNWKNPHKIALVSEDFE